jgi:23S rRNA (guanine2445-N2)-methyltransferase / 23S rRNA (guanine2069-N7)-methyltransferase
LLDPMCGSGTLLIEGLWMAADIAPGLLRTFGFTNWKPHQEAVWESLVEEANQRKARGLEHLDVRAIGFDQDRNVLEIAQENAQRAGVEAFIEFREARVEQLVRPDDANGLLITNPPYGERLGESSELMFLYRDLGDTLKQEFGGWRAGVFTGNPDLCEVVGLKTDKSYQLFNGPLESRLFLYTLYSQRKEGSIKEDIHELSEQAQMFANRLKKNLKKLQSMG